MATKRGRPRILERPTYVTVALPRDMLRRLDRFADDRLANRAEAVRTVLKAGLDRIERAGSRS